MFVLGMIRQRTAVHRRRGTLFCLPHPGERRFSVPASIDWWNTPAVRWGTLPLCCVVTPHRRLIDLQLPRVVGYGWLIWYGMVVRSDQIMRNLAARPPRVRKCVCPGHGHRWRHHRRLPPTK